MNKPFTHMIQWRRKGYWSPGVKFHSEEDAVSYAELRVNPAKGNGYRVVPIEIMPRELSTEECLVLMKCMHANPKHWRREVMYFLEKGKRPPQALHHDDLLILTEMGQQYPRDKLIKLNAEVIRNRLLMADNRERAKEIVKGAADIVALDTNPEVMLIPQGAFVQAWVFVPHRSEEEERGRQHDIAAYLAGPPRSDAA